MLKCYALGQTRLFPQVCINRSDVYLSLATNTSSSYSWHLFQRQIMHLGLRGLLTVHKAFVFFFPDNH